MDSLQPPLLNALAMALIVALPIGLVLLILARQFRAHRERQWLHEETMTALKQGIAVDPRGRENMSTDKSSEIRLEFGTNPSVELFWMRSLSIFLGVLGIFLGCGILVAFIISNNEGVRELWPMGLIPIFGGMGMVVLYLILSHVFKNDVHSDDVRSGDSGDSES